MLALDNFYREHDVYGITWEQPVATWARKRLHEMGLPTRGFTVVGGDALCDEMVVLELGRHVEMEFAMQDLAAGGEHWQDLGEYLTGLVDARRSEP